jgi:hypothetical protein
MATVLITLPLERAIHATLEYRGTRIQGGGKEWFQINRDAIVAIYKSITGASA